MEPRKKVVRTYVLRIDSSSEEETDPKETEDEKRKREAKVGQARLDVELLREVGFFFLKKLEKVLEEKTVCSLCSTSKILK